MFTSVGSGSEFFGFGFCLLENFGFGFDRVCKFQQFLGSGLSGFTSEVRVFGFVGFGSKFCYLANKKLHKMHCQLNNMTNKKL